jgi:hypothetical protein
MYERNELLNLLKLHNVDLIVVASKPKSSRKPLVRYQVQKTLIANAPTSILKIFTLFTEDQKFQSSLQSLIIVLSYSSITQIQSKRQSP